MPTAWRPWPLDGTSLSGLREPVLALDGVRPLHMVRAFPGREDDCRMRAGTASAVMGILHRTALYMVRTPQRNFRPDVSIGLLGDHSGCQP